MSIIYMVLKCNKGNPCFHNQVLKMLTEFEAAILFRLTIEPHSSSVLIWAMFYYGYGRLIQFKTFSAQFLKSLSPYFSREIFASVICYLFYKMLLIGHVSLSQAGLMFISNIDTAVSREHLRYFLFKEKKNEMNTVNHWGRMVNVE